MHDQALMFGDLSGVVFALRVARIDLVLNELPDDEFSLLTCLEEQHGKLYDKGSYGL